MALTDIQTERHTQTNIATYRLNRAKAWLGETFPKINMLDQHKIPDPKIQFIAIWDQKKKLIWIS